MLRIFSLLIFLVSFNSFSYAQSTLDLDQLNSAFADMVSDKVSTYDILDSGSIVVDKTLTDINNGNLVLNFNFVSTPLTLSTSNTATNFVVDGGLTLQTTDLGSDKKVDYELMVNIKTDLLPVLNHINELFQACQDLDPNDPFQTKLCDYVMLTKAATKASELVPALEALREALVTLVPNFAGTGIDKQISDLINSINIVQVNESAMVSALLNNASLYSIEVSGDIGLKFSDDGLYFNFNGAALLNQSDFDYFVTSLEGFLIDFQNNEPNAVDYVSGYSDFVFDLLEGIFL